MEKSVRFVLISMCSFEGSISGCIMLYVVGVSFLAVWLRFSPFFSESLILSLRDRPSTFNNLCTLSFMSLMI